MTNQLNQMRRFFQLYIKKNLSIINNPTYKHAQLVKCTPYNDIHPSIISLNIIRKGGKEKGARLFSQRMYKS